MTYKSEMDKDEILESIVEEFETAKDEWYEKSTPETTASYKALLKLVEKIGIFYYDYLGRRSV